MAATLGGRERAVGGSRRFAMRIPYLPTVAERSEPGERRGIRSPDSADREEATRLQRERQAAEAIRDRVERGAESHRTEAPTYSRRGRIEDAERDPERGREDEADSGERHEARESQAPREDPSQGKETPDPQR